MPGSVSVRPINHGTAGFRSRFRHQIRELLTQRSFQIVAGWTATIACARNRLPESDPDLASQPTLSPELGGLISLAWDSGCWRPT